MAYRGGAGPWVLSAILFLFAAVFGALHFTQTAKMEELQQKISDASPEELTNDNKPLGTTRNEAVLKLIKEKSDADAEIQRLKGEVSKRDGELEVKGGELAAYEMTASKLRADVKRAEGALKVGEDSAAKIREEAKEMVSREQSDLKGEITSLRDAGSKGRKIQEELNTKLTRSVETNNAITQVHLRKVVRLQRQQKALQGVIQEIRREEGKREAVQTEPYDGKIISLDLEHRTVVVNLGKFHNVTRGMRFDIIRFRRNQWDNMGIIELTDVGQSTSTAVIRDASTAVMMDPVTGWISPDPEARFSPYSARGPEQKAVRLVKITTSSKSTMREFDPIVLGDFITNPFYSKNKQYKFVVAGEKVRYSKRELEQQIVAHGGIIQTEVGVDTDFLVLGKVIQNDEEINALPDEARKRQEFARKMLKRSEVYTIPIMREVALFNFLRN